MGQKIYERSGAFLQRPAAEAIGRIHNRLAAQGFGLLIHDAYRPWYVTKMFWDATPPANRVFVADPSQGSRHNRGAAVDLTLFDLKSGQPIVTTGRYDDFPAAPFQLCRWKRRATLAARGLRNAMERDGFTVYAQEWVDSTATAGKIIRSATAHSMNWSRRGDNPGPAPFVPPGRCR